MRLRYGALCTLRAQRSRERQGHSRIPKLSSSKKNGDAGALRIVTQYRAKRAMVYELQHDGAELELQVSQADGEAGLWCVQARPGREQDAICIAESAPSRGQALQEVARRWIAESESRPLPKFDWDAISRLLAEVHAL